MNRRFRDGQKKGMSGGNSGLTYADSWNQSSGPISLVEGGSDTAALMTIGLLVVGRPSNRAGVSLLVNLLADIPAHCEIVAVAERDRKEDGDWPGRDGAVAVATQLAEALERPVAGALPPDDAMDARAWLQSLTQLQTERLADLFITGLERTVIRPPATHSTGVQTKKPSRSMTGEIPCFKLALNRWATQSFIWMPVRRVRESRGSTSKRLPSPWDWRPYEN